MTVPGLPWRRSSACESSWCLEAAIIEGDPDQPGGVLIRQTRTRVAISCSREEWEAFVAGVKAGEFDWPQT